VESGPITEEASPPELETVVVEADPGVQETLEPEEVGESAAEPVSESEGTFQTEEELPTPIQTDDPSQPDMPSIPDAESTVALRETEESVLEPESPHAEQTEATSFTPSTFRDALKDGGTGPQMAPIPGGAFKMGSGGMTASADEYPPHDVTVQPFAISRHEITVAEYANFAKATGRRLPRGVNKGKDTHPIVSVSWNDAIRYTQWLSKQTGKRYRLPSEAEWEYAASAGATSPHWWGYEVTDGQAHCFGCSNSAESRGPVEVGGFPPNAFGLYDTAGNVMEWVGDCYHRNYQGAPDDGRSWDGGDCSYRMVRGGAYNSPPPSIRTAKRAKRKFGRGYDTIGIRVVRER
jgi:formylglycine-generating enzyme required for sulfatase activity